MNKLHTYKIIASAVMQVKELSKERGFPLHAALWASWGTGKTVASKQVIEDIPDVFYLKFPARQLEPAQLIKEILLSIGVGPVRGYLNNYKLMERVFTSRGIMQPVLIVDEAQLLFTQPKLLSFLKDLSEDIKIGFSYVFVGDENLKIHISAEGHSLIKRIRVKVGIPPIEKDSIEKLSNFHNIKIPNVDKSYLILQSLNATTMDLDFALYIAKKSGMKELDEKKLRAFIKTAKKGE